MVIPRVSKFLVTGPSLSISESRENLFSGLQMLHTLLAGICSSTSSHFVKLAGTWSSTSPHFVEPTGTWNSTSPHFVKLAGTWSSASPHLVKLAGTWSSISPYSLLVPGSSSLQSPSMISLFVGLKCPTPLGVHSHKVMSRRFLQQSHCELWEEWWPKKKVSWKLKSYQYLFFWSLWNMLNQYFLDTYGSGVDLPFLWGNSMTFWLGLLPPDL